MKHKFDSAAVGVAVRLAAEKVTKCRRIAEAEARLMQVAKVRFKRAKKNWKLARKTARRSAKRLKQEEKNLATLEKHLKRAKARAAARISKEKAGSQPLVVVRQRIVRPRRRLRTASPAPAPAASASAPAAGPGAD